MLREGPPLTFIFFFFNDTATTEIYPLSLHDALPISTRTTSRPVCCRRTRRIRCCSSRRSEPASRRAARPSGTANRSEEHTSELQSQSNLVCRLLLEKKNNRQWP